MADVPLYQKPERGYIRMFLCTKQAGRGYIRMLTCTKKPERGHIRQNRPLRNRPFVSSRNLVGISAPKKIFRRNPPNSPQTPSWPLAPQLPLLLKDPPPPLGFSNKPPPLAPRTPPSPPPSRQNIRNVHLSGTGDSQRDSRESIRANHSQLKPLFLQRVRPIRANHSNFRFRANHTIKTSTKNIFCNNFCNLTKFL